MRSRAAVLWNKMVDGLTVKKILLILLGAMICSFGIHNIHQRTNITEGGVIGLMLFAEHWLKLSPAYITPVLDIACYLLAFRFLGGRFIKISAASLKESHPHDIHITKEAPNYSRQCCLPCRTVR